MFNFITKTAASVTILTTALILPVQTMAAVPNYDKNITALVNYLKANQEADGGITGFGGETSWAIMGFASVGIDPNSVEKGGVSLIDFLANNPPAPTSATAWERDLLAIVASGEDPTSFGGRNYVTTIEAFANAGQLGSTTAINDDFFGILALIAAGPSVNQQIIEDSIDFLIANQNNDGGWSYATATASDPDSTAIAVQALKAADNEGFTNTGLDQAISDGVDYLTSSQTASGGWDGGFGVNAGSTAWSVLALIGNDVNVTNGLNYLVTKQDCTSGGVDGGFGVDTYTSANSLIAFGQNSFPISPNNNNFVPSQEEICDDGQNPDDDNPPNPIPNDPPTTQPGQVLSASDNKQGQVLAATLPNTGSISDGEFSNAKDLAEKKLTSPLVWVGVLGVGSLLFIVSGRLKKNIIN